MLLAAGCFLCAKRCKIKTTRGRERESNNAHQCLLPSFLTILQPLSTRTSTYTKTQHQSNIIINKYIYNHQQHTYQKIKIDRYFFFSFFLPRRTTTSTSSSTVRHKPQLPHPLHCIRNVRRFIIQLPFITIHVLQ